VYQDSSRASAGGGGGGGRGVVLTLLVCYTSGRIQVVRAVVTEGQSGKEKELLF